MKKILLLSLVLVPMMGMGQGRHFDRILQQVENHPMLVAAQQHAEAGKAEARTGLLIPNPEVEGAYYWGDPAEIGIRWDLCISQSFEMPSVLARRARLRDLECHAADIEYSALRQQLLYEAQQACADMVYYKARYDIQQRRLATAARLAEVYRKRFDAGDCSILDHNRAQMNLAEVRRDADEALVQQNYCGTQLVYFTGNPEGEFPYSEYEPMQSDSTFLALLRADTLRTPGLLLLANRQNVARQQLLLSRSQWLPEMSVGYASENIVGETFRGVKVGLSLPIWSQGRAVKRDRAAYEAASREYEAQRAQMTSEQNALGMEIVSLSAALENLKSTFAQYNSLTLLDKALDAGEISLEQYLQQAGYYTDQELQIWETAHQLELAYLQYFSITL